MLIVCLQIHTWIQIGCLCSYAQSVVGVKFALLNVCTGEETVQYCFILIVGIPLRYHIVPKACAE